MNDLISILELAALVAPLGLRADLGDFEQVYDELARDPRLMRTASEVDRRVREHFERLKLPGEATAYDYLLLSLREKDVVATFNWDPFLLQALRRHRTLRRLPAVLFLHGNVAVGVCLSCRVKGLSGQTCGLITRQHYGVTRDIRDSYLAWHPRRSCEALAYATLQLEPWRSDWMPKTTALDALRAWVQPLIDEEDAQEKDRAPFSGMGRASR